MAWVRYDLMWEWSVVRSPYSVLASLAVRDRACPQPSSVARTTDHGSRMTD